MSKAMTVPTTYLFVPGSRADRFEKAWASSAHRVVMDLEDAVAPEEKEGARQQIGSFLRGLAPEAQERLIVRINDARSPWFAQDLAWLATLPTVGLMLPKSESAEDVQRACDGVHSRTVLALVETVRGVRRAEEIAQSPQVVRLAFGSLDYLFDLGLDLPGLALDLAGIELAVASRLADLPPPVAGVTQLVDEQAVEADCLVAKGLGFGAKLCIHPRQIDAVARAFAPDSESRAWAERVLSAWADAERAGAVGALLLDGRMIDKPVLLRARRILGL